MSSHRLASLLPRRRLREGLGMCQWHAQPYGSPCCNIWAARVKIPAMDALQIVSFSMVCVAILGCVLVVSRTLHRPRLDVFALLPPAGPAYRPPSAWPLAPPGGPVYRTLPPAGDPPALHEPGPASRAHQPAVASGALRVCVAYCYARRPSCLPRCASLVSACSSD